jgi:putative transposase
MVLSETGQIAYEMWFELPEHFPYVSLDEFVVMPNHIHGIIIIEPSNAIRTLDADVGTLHADVGTLHTDVGTVHATSLRPIPWN